MEFIYKSTQTIFVNEGWNSTWNKSSSSCISKGDSVGNCDEIESEKFKNYVSINAEEKSCNSVTERKENESDVDYVSDSFHSNCNSDCSCDSCSEDGSFDESSEDENSDSCSECSCCSSSINVNNNEVKNNKFIILSIFIMH
mgnify:CR=1 FL=1